MTELVAELLKESKKRLKNPLLSSFLFSWVVINWKGISYFLFSKEEIQYKIECVSIDYGDSNLYFFYPLYSALTFVLILPFIWAIIEYLSKWIKVTRASISSNTRTGQKEAEMGEVELDKVIAQVVSGKTEIEDLKKSNIELNKSNDHLKEIVEKNNEKSLSSLAQMNTIETDLTNCKTNSVKLKNELQVLKEKDSKSIDEILLLKMNYKQAVDKLKVCENELLEVTNSRDKIKGDLDEAKIDYAEKMRTIARLRDFINVSFNDDRTIGHTSINSIKSILDKHELKENEVLEDFYYILTRDYNNISHDKKQVYESAGLLDFDKKGIKFTDMGKLVFRFLYGEMKLLKEL
jgi:hypothetical protein